MVQYDFLSVLMMPTDYCNMNCVYCFNTRRTHEKQKNMSFETVKKAFSITLPYYKEVKFIWHGGEPLSMGMDFYKEVVKLQKSMNVYGTKITNSIQSNLTLLNEEYVEFLLENDFKIGSSFDGTTNELTRRNTKGILSGRDLVIKSGGKVGFICVVQSKNIDCLIQDYTWFKENKINYTLNQYMPNITGENDDLIVSKEHYTKCVCELFDYWMKDKDCNISISFFEHFIDYILFEEKKLCCYNSCLGKHIGIHYNGDIYNCNRTFSEEYSYGNVYDYNDIRDCFESSGFEKMLAEAITRRDWCKSNCEIFGFCAGGCNSCAQIIGDMTKINSYVCDTTKAVYKHIEKRLKEFLYDDDKINDLNPFLSDKMKDYLKKCEC